MTTETSNARGEWPARYACNGPEGTFWTDDATLANKLIASAFDRDEWTVTDTQNPTAATPPPAAPQPTSAPVGVDWPTIVEGLREADHFFDGDDRYWPHASKVRAAYRAALAAKQQEARNG